MARQFVAEAISGFQEEAASNSAATNILSIIPSVESYFADNGTYAGMTLDKLRADYENALDSSYEIASAAATTYCVQSTEGDKTFFKSGPTARILEGVCP